MRVISDEAVRRLGQIHERQELVGALTDDGRIQRMDLADEVERLGRTQPLEQRKIFRNHSTLRFTPTGSTTGSSPSIAMRPLEGRRRPVRHLIVVDLPAPFGPRNP